MILGLANRQFKGIPVAVFDPVTGQKITENIDMETVDYEKRDHFMRAYRDGDLLEVKPTLQGSVTLQQPVGVTNAK